MKNIVLIIVLFISCALYGQEVIEYNNKAGKVTFTISADEYYSEGNVNDIQRIVNAEKGNFIRISANSGILKQDVSGSFSSRKSSISSRNPSLKIEPVLIYKDGVRQIVKGQINVKIKSGVDISSIIKQWDFLVKQNEFDKNIYLLSSSIYNTQEIFNIVNILQKDNNIIFAEPNFIRLLNPNTSDPYFSSQWAIKQNNGIDLKIEKAWNITRGEGVRVAVLDEGVDLNHTDLKANLLLGYDATGNNSKGAPNYHTDDAHGTSCAGIIAAEANNNIGITGIAYDAKIFPIRIAYSNGIPLGIRGRGWITSDEIIGNAINWTWQKGADVLSNSWGGGSPSFIISEAINNALTKGRNGKGCVVVFATGNYNTEVSYPANSNADIITVGAISPCGERKSPSSCDTEKWGSNYGRELDVMAPGVLIATTDLQGDNGYNPKVFIHREAGGTKLTSDFSNKDYTNCFNGTSSACPHVAGVAALILSVNPDLTAKQVADIIEQTAQKVGGYNYQNTYTRPNGTWNNEMGYGLVDAYKALQKATIAGPDEFCLRTDATFELIAPIPNDATIKWEDPEYRLEIVSGQGTKSCVFRGTYWDGNRTIKAVVTYKDGTVKSFEKEVYVRYQGNWANAQYTIKNHPQSPYGTPCCDGSPKIIKHVILDDYMGGASIKVEWKNTIVYKDPKDNFEFRGTNREEEFVAKRYTADPLVVETKMRYISDCGTPTKWSNTIARYYGAIHQTSFRSASAYNSPVKSTNEDIPVYEFFTNRTSTLRVQTEDLQQWLDAKYSGKELNDKELQKVLYYLNNRDNLDKIGVKVFDFSGKRILQGDLDFGKSLDFNMSRYAKGFYIIIYEFGSISNGKVIYKP
jgi:subtilase family peptidase